MKKRITALALAFVMVLGTVAVAAGAEKTISVTPMSMTINGQTVTPLKSDGTPAEVFAYEGATYVPLRYLSELLGITVEWDKNDPDTAKLVNVPGFTASAAGLKAGTYTGVGAGNNGDITVEVTVDAASIKEVKVLSHLETKGICDSAVELIPGMIVENQTVGVDTVAGATNTSKGILAAVQDCIVQAGGDLAVFAKPVEKIAGEDQYLTADVVVIGGGGSGCAAALSAAENGASVIVIEASASLGGNTKASGGGYNTSYAARQQNMTMMNSLQTAKDLANEEPKSELQKKLQATLKADIAEYEKKGGAYQFDSPELHALQTYKGGDYVGDLELIYTFASKAPETADWLMAHGMEFKQDMIQVAGALWARSMETVKPRGSGYAIATSTAAKELGAEFLLNVKGESLIMDGDKVVGVEAVKNDGTAIHLSAGKGVVIATGGFSANREMVKEYLPDLPDTVLTSNTPAAQGDGIKMATAIGAATTGMEHIQLLPLGDKDDGSTNGWITGGVTHMIYVSQEGKRFVAEDERRDVLCNAIFALDGSYMWAIQDAADDRIKGREASVANLIAQGKVLAADTIEDLAVQIGCDPTTLKETVEKWNKAVAEKSDPEFGRTAFSTPITTPPYYASIRVPTVHHTMGGLKIDPDARVYSTKGGVISGLYAAGEVTGGIHGTNRLGGNAVADTQIFGRIAGASAATQK